MKTKLNKPETEAFIAGLSLGCLTTSPFAVQAAIGSESDIAVVVVVSLIVTLLFTLWRSARQLRLAIRHVGVKGEQVRVHAFRSGSFPDNPEVGAICLHTDTGIFYVFTGSEWALR